MAWDENARLLYVSDGPGVILTAEAIDWDGDGPAPAGNQIFGRVVILDEYLTYMSQRSFRGMGTPRLAILTDLATPANDWLYLAGGDEVHRVHLGALSISPTNQRANGPSWGASSVGLLGELAGCG